MWYCQKVEVCWNMLYFLVSSGKWNESKGYIVSTGLCATGFCFPQIEYEIPSHWVLNQVRSPCLGATGLSQLENFKLPFQGFGRSIISALSDALDLLLCSNLSCLQWILLFLGCRWLLTKLPLCEQQVQLPTYYLYCRHFLQYLLCLRNPSQLLV